MKDSKTQNSDKKKVRSGKIKALVLSLMWVLSFALPYCFTHHMASQNYFADIPGRSRYSKQPAQWRVDEANTEALRSGTLGLLVALSIFLLWRLDRVITRDKTDMGGSWMVFMLGAFATLLWIVWTSAGHLMIRAHDEIHQTPAQLPGLDAPTEIQQ